MNKQKILNVLGEIYGIVMVFVFTIFCLKATASWNPDKLAILKNRLLVSLMFLIPGFISLIFRKMMLRFFYIRAGLAFKDEASKQKAIKQIVYFGKYTLITGFAIVVLALILYSI